MIATPRYRPHEAVSAEDVYIAVDSSGEVLGMGVWRERGEKLPELVSLDSKPVGYIRIGEIKTVI